MFTSDEPTNHLDIETIEALGVGLTNYKGGVILVSHDQRLITMVCQELWVCSKGKVRVGYQVNCCHQIFSFYRCGAWMGDCRSISN